MLAGDVKEMVPLYYIYFGHVQHLKDWWNNIQEIMLEVLKKKFQISAKLSILGSTIKLQDLSFKKRWIILALTTSKPILLLRHWRKKGMPHYEEWSTTMAPLAAFERVTYSLLNKLHHFMFT